MAMGWLVASETFELNADGVELNGLRYTSADQVHAAIGLPAGARPNLFLVDTGAMERRLADLPAVARADVSAVLPDRLVVDVTEREAVFALRLTGTLEGTYLVDSDGVFLHDAEPDEPAALGLPLVDDTRRQFAPGFDAGGRRDAVSLAADLRLVSLAPAEIGSTYDALELTIDDDDGYVLTALPGGWRAIFGHYTATLRPVDIIDRQVECLRARVAAGEADIEAIYLSPLEDRCGTFLPDSTPRATPSESAPPSSAR